MNAPFKSRGRFRRRLGLGFVGLGLAWAALMTVSIWWWFGYCTNTWLADIGDGTLYPRRVEERGWATTLTGWCGGTNHDYARGQSREWKWTWWTWGARKTSWETTHAYSVWPLSPILLASGAAIFFPGWRAARRMRKNQCPACGYSRSGLLSSSPCPECGNEATAGIPAAVRELP